MITNMVLLNAFKKVLKVLNILQHSILNSTLLKEGRENILNLLLIKWHRKIRIMDLQ
jgi:hypothetical protein